MTEVKNGNLKVLIIETMQTVRQLMATILAGEYKELLFAEDADEGYRIAVAERPDVIITDDFLARSGERNACERVRGNSELRATPVIVTTARGSSVSELAYFETGCDQLLRKPFRCEDIHYAIRKAMKKRQQGKAMIQVLFRSGDIDMVDAQSLDRLVSEQELLCFRRQDGVAVIGRDLVRSNRPNEYRGPERRNRDGNLDDSRNFWAGG
jgi:DNA-binding response OmpR family regulator